MIAAWYDKQGPAPEVLQVGEFATPHDGPRSGRVLLSIPA